MLTRNLTEKHSICFGSEMLDQFAKLSGDTSPLHSIGRFPGDGPIVYGALLGLAALSWIQEKTSVPLRLRFAFLGMVRTGQRVDGSADKTPNGHKIRVTQSGRPVLIGDISSSRPDFDAFSRIWRKGVFGGTNIQIRKYETSREYIPALREQLLAQETCCPDWLIHLLSLSSYVVGMDRFATDVMWTGLEATASTTNRADTTVIALSRSEETAARIEYKCVAQFDSVQMRLLLHGRKPIVKAAAPLKTTETGLIAKGKKILVVGASSGLGSELSEILVRAGHCVIGIGRTPPQDLNITYDYIKGDARELETYFQLDEKLASLGWKHIDLVVNAASQIQDPFGLAEDTVSDYVSLVSADLGSTARALTYFTRRARDGSSFLFISSILLASPKPFFAPYVSAKAACEALLKVQAAEYPRLSFLAVRVPRFLSKQTNYSADATRLLTAADVAQCVLLAWEKAGSSGFSVETLLA